MRAFVFPRVQLLTYKQAAEKLACSERTVERMVAAGVLTKVAIGGRGAKPGGARVAREDVDAYIRGQLGVDPQTPEPITSGKRDAFFAKCGEIARRTGQDKLQVVDDTLALASGELDRPISSVNDLTSDEASTVLDQLDVQVRRLREEQE